MKSDEKPKAIAGLKLGKDTIHNYEVNVDKALSGEVFATITDKDTKKAYSLKRNPNKVQAQAVLLVPLAEWLGAELLTYLLAIVGSIVIGGITYVAASTLMDKIKNDPKNEYFAAYTIPKDAVYIAGPISYDTACARMRLGFDGKGYNDVFNKTKADALSVARGAGYGLDPHPLPDGEIGDKSNGEQYWHYHVWNKTYPTHSFYPG